jgi:hypothetical protein
LGGSTRLFAAMQDIWVSLHSIRSKINIASSVSSLTTSSCDTPFKTLLGILGYWTSSIQDLFEVGMPTRPLRGRPCQTPCSYARRFECLYTPFDQGHDLIFLLFWSIKPAMLSASMLGDYSMSASSMPSCFLRRNDLLGNLFSHPIVTRPTFPSLSFLDHHTGHPARHDARILLYECIFDAL